MTRHETLRDYCREAFERYASSTALVTQREELTFGELGDRVRRIARLLESEGVTPGEFVGLVLTSPDVFYEARLATIELGTPLFVLSPFFGPEAASRALQAVAPQLVFYDAHLQPDFPALLAQALPGARAVAARGPGGLYEGRLEALAPEPFDEPVPRDRLVAVGFTSGTTGPPKGLTTNFGALTEACDMFLEVMETGGASPATRFLNAMPIFGAGSGMIVPALYAGMTSYVFDRWNPAQAAEAISSDGIAMTFMTPSMIIDLLDLDPDAFDLSSLELLVYGSAIAPVSKLEEAVRRLGPILLQGYGMAEVLPPVSVLTPQEHGTSEHPADRSVLSSAGHVWPAAKVRIERGDGGEARSGEVGDIWVDSPTVTPGYWKDPERTAKSRKGRWWWSGDLGSWDDEGRLHIACRKADLMTRDGRPVFPRDIEEPCHEHPAVKEACAVQASGDGRIVVAVSVRERFRGALDPTQLAEELREVLTALGPPDDLPDDILVLDELPRSPLGKVLHREVRQALTTGALSVDGSGTADKVD